MSNAVLKMSTTWRQKNPPLPEYSPAVLRRFRPHFPPSHDASSGRGRVPSLHRFRGIPCVVLSRICIRIPSHKGLYQNRLGFAISILRPGTDLQSVSSRTAVKIPPDAGSLPHRGVSLCRRKTIANMAQHSSISNVQILAML